MKRFLTILIALLMMTTGLALGGTAQPLVGDTVTAAGTFAGEVDAYATCAQDNGGDTSTCDDPDPNGIVTSLPSDQDIKDFAESTGVPVSDVEDFVGAGGDCSTLPSDNALCALIEEILSTPQPSVDGDTVTIPVPGGPVIKIKADPNDNNVVIWLDDEVVYPPADGVGAEEQAIVTFPWFSPNKLAGRSTTIYVDVDSTPYPGSTCDLGCMDNSIHEENGKDWARIRFDNDPDSEDDENGDGVTDEDDLMGPFTNGAIHIEPFCAPLFNGCLGNVAFNPFENDGTRTLSISELHLKAAPNNDYSRYIIWHDLDDDGHSHVSEINCASNWFHQESHCDDRDGDRLTEAAEEDWGTNNIAKDTDGDGLEDGFEDKNSDGKLAPLPAGWTGDPIPVPGEANDVMETDPTLWDMDGDQESDKRDTHPRHGFVDPDAGFELLRGRDIVYSDNGRGPVTGAIRDSDKDGDGLYDACERQRSGTAGDEDPYAGLSTLGAFNTETDHDYDADGDGLLAVDECENWRKSTDPASRDYVKDGSYVFRSHLDDFDTDDDGLDDWEEDQGKLKPGTYAPHVVTAFGATRPNDADTDEDHLHDGIEVFGDWNGDSVIQRWDSLNNLGANVDAFAAMGVGVDGTGPTWSAINARLGADIKAGICAGVARIAAGTALAEEAYLENVECTYEATLEEWMVSFDLEAEYPVVTDPNHYDTDRDGIDDDEELRGKWDFWMSHCGSGGSQRCRNIPQTDLLDDNGDPVKYDNDDKVKRPDESVRGQYFAPTDPTVMDTDDDGFDDGHEVKDSQAYGDLGPDFCHPDGGNGHGNHDCNGGRGSDPFLWDTDFDGMPDAEELTGSYSFLRDGWELAIILSGDSTQRGNVRLWDRDGDGLGDAYEVKDSALRPGDADAPYDPFNNPARYDCGGVCDGGFGTDPGLSDTDIDGVTDREEVMADWSAYTGTAAYTDATDPLDPDTDDDGVLDGEEIQGRWVTLTSPTQDFSGFVTAEEVDEKTFLASDPTNPDTDGDTLLDGEEVKDTENPQGCPSRFDGVLLGIDWNNIDGGIVLPDDIATGEGCDGGHGTEAALADTDGDTYSDDAELVAGTDPLDPLDFPDGDADNDGLNDEWERDYFGGTEAQDGDGDPDFDGFTNAEEQATRDGDPDTPESDPTDRESTPDDRDADGLAFEWEDRFFGGEQFHGPSDDPDEDDLSNAEEQDLGTDPTDADTDGDGLEDGAEVARGTNPGTVDDDADMRAAAKDTDGDGLTDGEEVSGVRNPWNAGDDATPSGAPGRPTDPTRADSDFDRLTDLEEIEGRDGDEATLDDSTDPNRADTDADGFNDGVEVVFGDAGDERDPEENPGNEALSMGRVPNPTKLFDRDCDFTTPTTWDVSDPADPGLWNGSEEGCDDSTGPELAGFALSTATGAVAIVEEALRQIDPNEPVHGVVVVASGIVADAEGEVGQIIRNSDFLDENDPHDLDGNNRRFEPNGQVDLIERNVVYIDVDEESQRDASEFDGDGTGFTIVLVDASTGSPTGATPSGALMVVRVGDVAGTPEAEAVVLQVGKGGNTRTVCVTEGGAVYSSTSGFASNGCGNVMTDQDGDSIPSAVDNCPTVANADQSDIDEDGKGDACDDDIDGDGTPNDQDAFPKNPDEDTDSDGDGVGDESDAFPGDSSRTKDADEDGVAEDGPTPDNCPEVANPDQADQDGDGVGDACDDDVDGDGYHNDIEAAVGSDPARADSTPETVVDDTIEGAARDSDDDGVPDVVDLYEGDDLGDEDGDGIPNAVDPEPTVHAYDANGNGMPDAAEPLFAPSCTEYDGNKPEHAVFFCHHSAGGGAGSVLYGEEWEGYAIIVMGAIIRL